MAAAFSNTIPVYKDIYDRMMLYQETLRPDKDIQAIVEQYRTSRFCPRPILYENYFSTAASGNDSFTARTVADSPPFYFF
jgi:hypothetical protein